MDRPFRNRPPPVQADGTAVGDTLRTPVQRQRPNAFPPQYIYTNDNQFLPAQPVQAGRDQTLDGTLAAIRLESPSPPLAPGAFPLNQVRYPQVPDVRGSSVAPFDFGDEPRVPTFPAIAP